MLAQVKIESWEREKEKQRAGQSPPVGLCWLTSDGVFTIFQEEKLRLTKGKGCVFLRSHKMCDRIRTQNSGLHAIALSTFRVAWRTAPHLSIASPSPRMSNRASYLSTMVINMTSFLFYILNSSLPT